VIAVRKRRNIEKMRGKMGNGCGSQTPMKSRDECNGRRSEGSVYLKIEDGRLKIED